MSIAEVLSNESLRSQLLNGMNPIVLRSVDGFVHHDWPDKLVWEEDPSGAVSTNNFWNKTFPRARPIKRFAILWHDWMPFKISIFVWRIWHRALSTHERIKKLGFMLVSKCACCTKSKEESLEHLFLESELANIMWDFLVPIFRKPRPRTLHQLIYFWGTQADFKNWVDCMAFGLLCCSMWDIWKYRCSVMYGEGSLGWSPGRFSIMRWAPIIAKGLKVGERPNMLMNKICEELQLASPSSLYPKYIWLPWQPSAGGPTANIAVHNMHDRAQMGAIIRDSNGRFVGAVKITLLSRPFLESLSCIIDAVHHAGLSFQCVKCSHADMKLLRKYANLDWEQYCVKRTLARLLINVKVFHVSQAVNNPATALCYSDWTGETSQFNHLPPSVRGSLLVDHIPSPCLHYDQIISIQ